MSIESAMAALNTPVESPTTQQVGTPPSVTPKEGPQTLQEAIKPVKQEVKPGADRFAALAKKERQLQQQMQQLKLQQAEVDKYKSARETALQNPLEALKQLGLTYDQITQFMLNGQKPTPELEMQGIKQEIEKLRTEQADKERKQVEQQQAQAKADYQRTLSEFDQEVQDFVKSNSEKYELTSMYNGEAIVRATIEQHFAQTKKIMSVEEATELVEKYFEDQVTAAQKTKKFQAKQSPKEASQPKKEMGSKQPTPTLSNELTSSAPSMLPAKTENDRLQRAMAALNQAG